jgi:CRP-like cAMP-binding protein
MNEFDLHHSLLFKGVDEVYINKFLSKCDLIDLPKGEFLFHQSEIGDTMYIIESGELQVLLDGDSTGPDAPKNQILGTIKEGTVIGELCVFGQQKRSASICALVDAQLFKIDGEDFRVRIYAKELDALLICYNIAKVLSERLSVTDNLLAHSTKDTHTQIKSYLHKNKGL